MTETPTVRQRGEEPLKTLLLKGTPPDENNEVSVEHLTQLLGLNSSWSIYKWIKKGTISAKRAKQVVALSDGELVTLEEFHDFLQ